MDFFFIIKSFPKIKIDQSFNTSFSRMTEFIYEIKALYLFELCMNPSYIRPSKIKSCQDGGAHRQHSSVL